MEEILLAYIKDNNYIAKIPVNPSIDLLLAIIVNGAFCEGYEEGYAEGVASQKNT